MEGFSLYNISEYLLHQLIYVVSGVKLKYSDNLETIILAPLDVNEHYVEWAKLAIEKEFNLKVKISRKLRDKFPIPNKSHFILRKLLKDLKFYEQDKTTGLIFITRKRILLRDRLMLRVLHSVFPILGVAYIIPGVCVVTTFENRMPKNTFDHTISHELGHLLGKHGYPISK